MEGEKQIEVELNEKVLQVIDNFDFSPLLTQIADIYPPCEKGHVLDVRAFLVASNLIQKLTPMVFSMMGVTQLDWVSKRLMDIMIGSMFKLSEVEIRFYSDLLDPDLCGNFSNKIPDAVWKGLRRKAKQFLEVPEEREGLTEKQIHYLKELEAGRVPVQVSSDSYQQWISVNSILLLGENYQSDVLKVGLPFDQIPESVKAFVEEQRNLPPESSLLIKD